MSVSLGNGCVNIDGEPLFIFNGEIINYRLPAALWRDRLEKLRAGALNTVSAYWAWNFHSAGHGEADFASPDRHVRNFLTLCAEAGLYVIARPEPYVCNEWDLGGYPAWLLKEDSGDWRSDDPQHLHFCREWFGQIHRELAPFQQHRGGPIILEQIENEHRWNARGYLTALCDFAREDGMTGPPEATTDWKCMDLRCQTPIGMVPAVRIGARSAGTRRKWKSHPLSGTGRFFWNVRRWKRPGFMLVAAAWATPTWPPAARLI